MKKGEDFLKSMSSMAESTLKIYNAYNAIETAQKKKQQQRRRGDLKWRYPIQLFLDTTGNFEKRFFAERYESTVKSQWR